MRITAPLLAIAGTCLLSFTAGKHFLLKDTQDPQRLRIAQESDTAATDATQKPVLDSG